MTHCKQLSYWAKQHKWSSRFIIIISFIIMNALGIITGFLFSDLNIEFSAWFLVLAILIFGIAWLRYPAKKSSPYGFRKTCDAVLISTTFLMFMYFGNRQVTPISPSVFSASAITSTLLPKDSTKTYKSPEDFKKSLQDKNGKPLKWKERKKLLKQQVKAIKKDKTLSAGGKVGLIILCVVMALVLTYLVAAIACSLSCSGAEGAAVVVAIFGLAGVALLTFFVIRSIVRKSRREKEKELNEKMGIPNN
jgi:uncharacterized membrane protein